MLNDIDLMEVKAATPGLWLKKWFVLAAGTMDDFNAMTVGWGAVGGMWGKPFVQVVVRPGRHTYSYMERYDTFTLSSFPRSCREALVILGTKSGKDGDKIAASGLTPIPSGVVEAPSFSEAELVLECRKLYRQDMDPLCFLYEGIEEHYPDGDYHCIYYGEILRAAATPDWR